MKTIPFLFDGFDIDVGKSGDFLTFDLPCFVKSFQKSCAILNVFITTIAMWNSGILAIFGLVLADFGLFWEGGGGGVARLVFFFCTLKTDREAAKWDI